MLSCIGSLASLRVFALTLGRALRFLASLQHPSNDLAARCIQSKQKVSSLHVDCFDLVAARNWGCLLDSGSERVPVVVLGTCVSRSFLPFIFFQQKPFLSSPSIRRGYEFLSFLRFIIFLRFIVFLSNVFHCSIPVFPFYIPHLQQPRSATESPTLPKSAELVLRNPGRRSAVALKAQEHCYSGTAVSAPRPSVHRKVHLCERERQESTAQSIRQLQ
jgi:hypothetical protein